MGGVRGALPRRSRQVRLPKDGVHLHLAVGVEVRRPRDNRQIIRYCNRSAENDIRKTWLRMAMKDSRPLLQLIVPQISQKEYSLCEISLLPLQVCQWNQEQPSHLESCP